ncbi:MAG: phosphotransferase [Pseudomonadales bacterium]
MDVLMIPNRIEDFTVDWLNAVLASTIDAQVTECRVWQSEEPGQTAEIVVIEAVFDRDDPALPTRMIGKYTSQNPQVIEEIINVFDQYRRETSFYRDFEDPGIAIPKCLYQAFDAERQAFVLLMKDLGPASSPSWGVSTDQVEYGLRQLPRLHARWWNHERLREKDYFVQFDDEHFFAMGFGGAAAIVPGLAAHFDNVAVTEALMPAVAEKLPKLQALYGTRPFTLVHGDYHAKQLFFPTDAGGEFAAIDWQFPFVAQGPWDFARLLVVTTPTEFRRGNERRLMEVYLEGLRAEGVSDYGKQDFELDYRLGMIISHMINVIAIGSTDVSIVARECESLGVDWKEVLFYRLQRALEEWDVLGLVESL